MAREIFWRLHCTSAPETVYALWTTDAGRSRFWAEESRASEAGFTLRFPDGTEAHCTILEAIAPERFVFTYFGSRVEVALTRDPQGGTDLSLRNSGVADDDYEEVHAGWLNVLFPLKAAADFGVDLRNHDPGRTWRQGYVDQ